MPVSRFFPHPIRVLLAGLMLASCASPAPQQAVRQAVQRNPGYESAQMNSVLTQRASLALPGARLELVLRVPGMPGKYPLIVFMAGLGEPADAAATLMDHWTEAGYAVLAMQGTPDGPAMMAGARGKGRASRELAAQAYGPDRLAQRLGWLDGVLGNLRAGTVPDGLSSDNVARIDSTQLILAGFDIGAQTVQAAAGEHWAGVAARRLPEGVRGLILLSPHAGPGGESAATRYAAIQVPVLAVSSDEDVDGFDFVTQPAVRRQVFEHLPGSEKYLLQLSWASHAVVGGGGGLGAGFSVEDRAGKPEDKAEGRGGNGGRGGPGGAGGPGGQGGPGGGSGGGPGGGMGGDRGGPPGGASGKPKGGGEPAQPMDDAEQAKSLRAVSLAFIDMQLRGDDIARNWLLRDANRWLGQTGKFYGR